MKPLVLITFLLGSSLIEFSFGRDSVSKPDKYAAEKINYTSRFDSLDKAIAQLSKQNKELHQRLSELSLFMSKTLEMCQGQVNEIHSNVTKSKDLENLDHLDDTSRKNSNITILDFDDHESFAVEMTMLRHGKGLMDLNYSDFGCSGVAIPRNVEAVSGVYKIRVPNRDGTDAYCALRNSGGAWTVILRRGAEDTTGIVSKRESFERKWTDYVVGFGNVSRDHFLGLENIYELTKESVQELRIELVNWQGEKKILTFPSFKLGNATEFYKLGLMDNDSSTTGLETSLTMSNGNPFSTFDMRKTKDDICTETFGAAWWHGPNTCAYAQLTGEYFDSMNATEFKGILWYPWTSWDQSLKEAWMMIKPKS